MTPPDPQSVANSGGYAPYWERFYRGLEAAPASRALWDVAPAHAVAQDWQRFEPYFDTQLPLVDVGCGTGAQTAWLAQKFSPVIGLDVSRRAIEVASATHSSSAAQFRLQDGEAAEVVALGEELGDSNVYIRGVLHQLRAADLPRYQQALAALVGATGAIYFIEVAEGIRDYLGSAGGHFAALPDSIRRTLISRFPPGGVSLANLQEYFPDDAFRVVTAGETGLNTNLCFADDQALVIPAVYGIVRSVTMEQSNGN